jgi:hypothetical protein
MRFLVPVLGAACLLFGTAFAQSTSCGWEFGRWVCRQENPATERRPAQRSRPQLNFATPNTTFRNTLDRDRARNEAQQQEALRQEVGKAIASGRCLDARDMALRAGDLILAQQVASLCNNR